MIEAFLANHYRQKPNIFAHGGTYAADQMRIVQHRYDSARSWVVQL